VSLTELERASRVLAVAALHFCGLDSGGSDAPA
jgi:hypothetical protein